MRYRNDPEGTRLPIKLDTTTNGEFAPIPLAPVHHRARRLALDSATINARRLNLTRRSFLVSACGAATALLAMNAAYATGGRRGGYYDLPAAAALDMQVARSELDRGEFVFDVQGHFVSPTGAWTRTLPPGAEPLKSFTDLRGCASASAPGLGYLQCLGADAFIKDVFLDSDTDLVVLSFVPSTRKGEPLTIEEAAATAKIVERMEGTHRMLLHGRVNPNQAGDLDGMDELAARYPIAAWKTYTQWGPDGKGFFLDDDVGVAMIEKARKLGIRKIAVHKGLPFGPQSYAHSTCVDIGRVAKRYPDVELSRLSLRLRRRQARGTVRSAQHRRHRRIGHQPARERDPARGQRLRGAGIDVAFPDARSRQRRACAGEAVQVRWRRQCLMGHGLDLVRLAAGPDPGVSRVPDFRRARRKARLSEDHAGAARQGVRSQRLARVLDSGGRAEETSRRRQRRRRASRVSRARRSELHHVRAEDPPRIPEPERLGRLALLRTCARHGWVTSHAFFRNASSSNALSIDPETGSPLA